MVSGRGLRARRGQARRPEAGVQSERIYTQQRYVVSEAARRIAGMQHHLPDARHSLPGASGPRAAT